jgi:hypothetical protein
MKPLKDCQGYCLCSKKESSGTITRAWKAWWYTEDGKRHFTSFACLKWGFDRAKYLARYSAILKQRVVREEVSI